jgi:gluconolactonase
VAPNGDMYLTDPFYKRTWWDHDTMALPNEEVYYLAAGSTNAVLVTTDLKKPNGITGTPDGNKLFVSDIGAGQTWSYDILPNGTLANKTYFCGLGSDGMTIDVDGNLYLTGHGVTIFDRSGKQTGHIDVPEKWTGNVCLGGKDHKTLFITASKTLYCIRVQVPGANPAK